MRLRDGLVRGVLIVGILTTLATSIATYQRDAMGTRTLTGPELVRVVIRLNEPANEQAEHVRVAFTWTGSRAVMIVPDDPTMPPFALASFHSVDVIEQCNAAAGPCTARFTVDPGTPPSTGDLQITATISRLGDGSLCFPEERDFSADATIEVAFE